MRYLKKPLVVDAIQVKFIPRAGVSYQVTPELLELFGDFEDWYTQKRFLFIETLEGWSMAKEGDYIIKGIAGEFYPCRRDIFLETYEPFGGGTGYVGADL